MSGLMNLPSSLTLAKVLAGLDAQILAHSTSKGCVARRIFLLGGPKMIDFASVLRILEGECQRATPIDSPAGQAYGGQVGKDT